MDFNVNVNLNIWDNENVKTGNATAILIVHTCILLLMYNFMLYSHHNSPKATGLGKKS